MKLKENEKNGLQIILMGFAVVIVCYLMIVLTKDNYKPIREDVVVLKHAQAPYNEPHGYSYILITDKGEVYCKAIPWAKIHDNDHINIGVLKDYEGLPVVMY